MANLSNLFIRSICVAVVLCGQAPFTITQSQRIQAPQVTVRLKATLTGHTRTIERIAFSPDGKLLGTSSYDQTVRLWDAHTGELKAILLGEDKAKWELERWYFNRQYLITHEDFPDVFVGPLKAELNGGASGRAISPDKRMLLTLKPKDSRNFFERDEVLQLWDVATGLLQLTFEKIPYGISRIYWSPDGKSIVVEGSGRTRARLMDVSTGRVKAKLPYETCTADSWSLWGDDDCGVFTFNSDGSVFLKEKGPLKLWSASSGELLAELKSARLPATFSPTAKELLVTSSKDKRTALLWEVVVK